MITLEEAAILFEEYKLETYPNSYNEYNYNMYDCLTRNHITRRLPVYILVKEYKLETYPNSHPVYILIKDNEYIETRENIKKYKDYTKTLFVDKNHLKRFFEKELSPKFSCYEFYGFDEDKNNEEYKQEEYKQSEVTKLLRSGLKNIKYDDSWCDLFKEWHDELDELSVEMKYISENK